MGVLLLSCPLRDCQSPLCRLPLAELGSECKMKANSVAKFLNNPQNRACAAFCSGGLGQIDHDHLKKNDPEIGMLIVKIGGPAYRIGMGGGAASSVPSGGSSRAELDFNAVQVVARSAYYWQACSTALRVSSLGPAAATLNSEKVTHQSPTCRLEAQPDRLYFECCAGWNAHGRLACLPVC